MLVGEFDKDVFEAGSERTNFCDGDAVSQELSAEHVKIEMVLDERVDGLTENGGAADAGEVTRESERARDFRSGDFDAQRAGRLNVREFTQRIGRAVGDELSVINVGDVAAALGLVHVMGGDEKRDAMAGKLEEEIPKLAARHRLDPGGGLVREKKGRLVRQGAAEAQALLAAAGELRGPAVRLSCEAVLRGKCAPAALQPRR